MATSFSLTNFLSFLFPSSPPPKTSLPPVNLSISSSQPHSLQQKSNKDANFIAPLVAQEGNGGGLSTDLPSVICPSLAYSNTLFFRSAYNVQVIVDENEPEERLLGRFRREVMRAGVIQECKRRRFHENKQDEKKRKTREAAKRNKRRRSAPRGPFQNKTEVPAAKKEEEDDDNWDMPEGL